MNVFWNVNSLYKHDKRRFNKQILELATIWNAIYANLKEEKAGYQHHPVVKFYQNNILSLYGITMEYYFKKPSHKSWAKLNKIYKDVLKHKHVNSVLFLKSHHKSKCFVSKSVPRYIKIICWVADLFSTPLAYWFYCKLYKWRDK
jgi:hypothetical protein